MIGTVIVSNVLPNIECLLIKIIFQNMRCCSILIHNQVFSGHNFDVFFLRQIPGRRARFNIIRNNVLKRVIFSWKMTYSKRPEIIVFNLNVIVSNDSR